MGDKRARRGSVVGIPRYGRPMIVLAATIVGAVLGRRAGRKLGRAVEQEIAWRVAEEYQRQQAWAAYYSRQQERARPDT